MSKNKNQFFGKTTLITGSNGDIGRELLRSFASQGSDIVACQRVATESSEEFLSNLINKYGVAITPLYFDLASDDEIKSAMLKLHKGKITIDILVNNAGIAHGSLLEMTSIAKLKEIFQINFFSQVLLTQLVVKSMRRKKSGSIINIGSIAGIDGFSGYTAYGSSKAALLHLTKVLAKELASAGIRVNAIAPGLVDTKMAQLMEQKAKYEMVAKSYFSRLATSEEIATAAIFLASSDASFINGQILRVDGGM